jgi:triacylglycerol lipase
MPGKNQSLLFRLTLAVCALTFFIMSGSVPASTIEKVQSAQQKDCVVLLHGLGRTSSSMNRLEKAFEREGFLTSNIGYPSRKYPIEQLADEAVSEGVNSCKEQGAERIHFVTHSMGGILLRYYLKKESIDGLGHTVMLAPPNQGSEIVDEFGHVGIIQSFLGPAGLQLSTQPDSIPNTLGPVDYSVGIIAGDRHSLFDSQFAEYIPGVDDGKVSIERAKLEGMSDFIVLPHSHTMIMKGDDVIVQAIQFVRVGSFYPDGSQLPRLESFDVEHPFLDYSDE